MTPCWLSIRTLSPVISTSNNASLGNPLSLPYLTGAQLLGVAASKLHRQWGEVLSIRRFQRGDIRFGDALPAADISVAPVPMPLCFHHPKASDKWNRWRNHMVERIPLKAQPKQFRNDYLGGKEHHFRTRMEASERTAMKGGIARKGSLHSHHAISANQLFLARVDIDEAVPKQARQELFGALAGKIRLGRSRSAEFGLVMLEWLNHPPLTPPLREKVDGLVPVLLMSECCLIDPDTGGPTFDLRPSMLGLPDDAFKIDPAHTFVRTRTYSPFNAYRQRPNHERHVLVQGSVFGLCSIEVSLKDLRTAFAKGIGRHLQQGLGRTLVAPSFLLEGSYQPWYANKTPVESTDPLADLQDDPILRWALQRQRAHQNRETSFTLANQWRAELRSSFPKTVSQSQWGRVRSIAFASTTHDELIHHLRGALVENAKKPGESRVCHAWGRPERGGNATLGERVVDMISNKPENGLRTTQIFAALMVRAEEQK